MPMNFDIGSLLMSLFGAYSGATQSGTAGGMGGAVGGTEAGMAPVNMNTTTVSPSMARTASPFSSMSPYQGAISGAMNPYQTMLGENNNWLHMLLMSNLFGRRR